MVTWRDIKKSLENVSDDRLDDPAVVLIDDDTIAIDLLEIELPEILDDRLMAVPLKEFV